MGSSVLKRIEGVKQACLRQDPLSGEPVKHVYLTVIKATLPKGDRIRLAGRQGPLGRLCNVKEAEERTGYACVAVFKASEVLAFLEENGL